MKRSWMMLGVAVVAAVMTVASSAVPLAATASAQPAPTVSVSVSTGLTDGQQVHVRADGFLSNHPIGLLQCPAGSLPPAGCPGFLIVKRADGTGAVSFDIVVRRMLSADPVPSDCALAGACVILAYDLDGGSSATAPVTFDPNVTPEPPLAIDLGIDAAGGILSLAADGSVTVTGTVTCNAVADVELSVRLSSTTGNAEGHVSNQPCGPEPTAWTVVVTGSGPTLEPGPAQVEVDGFSPDGGGPNVAFAVGVTLKGSGSDTADYYLALGDSLVTGFAASPGQGYVDDLLAYYRQQDPNLRVINLGCNSEVSAGLIANGLCDFGGQSQLQATESFIASHPGKVKLITIDIGGNDVVFCGTRPAVEQGPCLSDALTVLDANMATILGRLRAAAGARVPLLGMNYFNPFLNHWLGGESDKAFSHLTTVGLNAVNQHLESSFLAYSVPVANVAGAFHVDDYDTLVNSPYGTIPINVALACRWLDIGCEVGGVGSFGDDANAEGYAVIAAEFIKLLPRLTPDVVPTPPEPVTPVLPTTPPAVVTPATDGRGGRPSPVAETEVARPVAAAPSFTG